MSTCIVYALIDPRSGDAVYVGVTTTSLLRRLQGHCCDFRDRTKRSSWVKELRKQGLKPKIEPLETGLSHNDALIIERFWISNLRSCGARLLNHHDGGRLAPEEVRAIMSKKARERPHRKLSKEHRAKISRGLRGRRLSKEARQKIGDAHRGLKHSEETKKLISLSKKGKPATDGWLKKMSTPIRSVRLADGVEEVHQSIRACCRNLELSDNQVLRVLNKTTAQGGGYVFERIE